MKLSCLMPRGLTVLAVTVLVVSQAGSALAQYGPYGTSYPGNQGYQTYQPQQVYQPHQAYVPQGGLGGPQFMPGPQNSQPQFNNQPKFMQQPQYVAARQAVPGNLPEMSQPLESVPPGPMQSQPIQQPAEYAPQQAPQQYSQDTQGMYENYSASAGCSSGSCSNGAGYACDGYGNYNQPSYSQPSYANYGMGYGNVPRRHWFGGVYGLLMDRISCDNSPLVYTTDMPGAGHYPTEDEVVMTYGDIDGDMQGGAEIRFGATFGCGGSGCYGGCGTGCRTSMLGWEAGYWALSEDTTYATVYDADRYADDGNMTYGMKPFTRLRHNPGSGWRPVNHYFAYGVPSADYYTAYGNLAPQIRSIVARNSFSMQSVELNLVCLPTIGGGYAGSGYAGGCDTYGGGCDSCGSGGCEGGGCGIGGGGYGCGGGRFGGSHGAYCYSGPRCQFSSFLGARYVRFDEEFMLRSNYDMYDYTDPADHMYVSSGSLAYYTETDNHLVGCQLGGNGCYHLGCCGRVALHFGANGGIYGNYIEMRQFFDGQVYDDGTNMPYDEMDEEENISFLGEVRLGASYQCTCNCRLYGGYRALGVTGVALATNQEISTTDMPYTNCNSSIFLHGLQSGLEFMY